MEHGRYEILRTLGRGGFGEVSLARYHGEGGFTRLVAVKRVLDDSPGHGRRLLDEARHLALVSHRAVVRVDRVVRLEDRWALVMEYVPGADLDQLFSLAPLPTRVLAELGAEVAGALHAAWHAPGPDGEPLHLMHMDLKPSNLRLTAQGEVRVLDFGLSQIWRPGERAARVVGTPGYLAPERLLGRAGPEADIYALGAMLHALATGVSPSGPVALSEVAGDGLGPVLREMLDPDPAARPTARAIEDSLAARGYDGPRLRAWAEQFVTPLGDATHHPSHTPALTFAFEPAAERLPEHNLRAELDAWFGRQRELDRAASLLADGARQVSLTGPGGIGKTRLALRVARAHLASFPGGAWFCACESATDATALCLAVAAVLDVPPVGTDLSLQLGRALADRGRLLLVLDNLEQCAAAAASVVAQWMEAAPELVVICTTRRVLGLPGERVLTLDPLGDGEAVDLLVDRVRRRDPEVDPTRDAPALAALAAQLDGLPLALELAAARVHLLGVQGLLARMSERFQVLRQRGRPTRQATLERAIGTSWDLLDVHEQKALSQLSVFRAPFTLEAAAQVIAVDDDAAPWEEDLVEALIDHSLVRRLRRGPQVALTLLVSIRAFAARHLDGPDRRQAELRHAAWMARLGAEEALARLEEPGAAERIGALERVRDDLVVATERTVRYRVPALAGPLALAVGALALRRGPFSLGIVVLRSALELDLALRHEDAVLQCLVRLLDRTSERTGWAQLVERGLAAATRAGAPRSVLLWKTMATRSHPRVEQEAQLRAIAAEAPPGAGRAKALADLGNLLGRFGRLEAAREALEASAAHEEVPFTGGRVLGLCLRLLRRHAAAESVYLRLLSAQEARGDRVAVSYLQGNLGILLCAQGRHREARGLYHAAATAHRRDGYWRPLGAVVGNLAELEAELGHDAEAMRAVEDCMAIYREIRLREGLGVARVTRSLLLERAGDLQGAEAEVEQAAALLEGGPPRPRAAVMHRRGQLWLRTGRPAGAVLEELLAVAVEMGDREYVARAHGLLACCATEGEVVSRHLEAAFGALDPLDVMRTEVALRGVDVAIARLGAGPARDLVEAALAALVDLPPLPRGRRLLAGCALALGVGDPHASALAAGATAALAEAELGPHSPEAARLRALRLRLSSGAP